MQAVANLTNRREKTLQALDKAKNIHKCMKAAGVTEDDIQREVIKARAEVRRRRSDSR